MSNISRIGAALALWGAVTASPSLAAIDRAGAAAVFQQAKALCEHDGGKLWGISECGPILLVDPTDLTIVANAPDAGGILRSSNGVYVGSLPSTEILANTPLEWSGTRWTELLWPLNPKGAVDPHDDSWRRVMLAHELFHRIQPRLNLTRPEAGNQHLDTFDGRYLLQLEWRALAKALQAGTATGRRMAIADALRFRRERYRLFPAAAGEEAALEIDEGVPEYTGARIGLWTPKERTAYAVHDLSAFVDSPSFVRSFAYATGPAYGLLLDRKDSTWRTRLNSGQRLDQLLASAYGLEYLPSADLKAREAAYDDGSLRLSEAAREAARQARLAVLMAKLVDGPVLVLPLHHVSYQFNPQTLQPLGDAGTVYPTLHLNGEFGELVVEDGALMDKDMKSAQVSAVGIDTTSLKGPGWRLSLNKGWRLEPGPRQGDWRVAPPP